MKKQDIIAQWFELHGPGLKAKGITWTYDFDSDTYKFRRETTRTSFAMKDATTQTGIDIIQELGG